MAALLKFAPWHGAASTAETVAGLDRLARASLGRRDNLRPTLVCHWMQDAAGRLTCEWDFDVPVG